MDLCANTRCVDTAACSCIPDELISSMRQETARNKKFSFYQIDDDYRESSKKKVEFTFADDEVASIAACSYASSQSSRKEQDISTGEYTPKQNTVENLVCVHDVKEIAVDEDPKLEKTPPAENNDMPSIVTKSSSKESNATETDEGTNSPDAQIVISPTNILTSEMISKYLTDEERKKIGIKVIAAKIYEKDEYALPTEKNAPESICDVCEMPKLTKKGVFVECIVCPELLKKIFKKVKEPKRSQNQQLLDKEKRQLRKEEQRIEEMMRQIEEKNKTHHQTALDGELGINYDDGYVAPENRKEVPSYLHIPLEISTNTYRKKAERRDRIESYDIFAVADMDLSIGTPKFSERPDRFEKVGGKKELKSFGEVKPLPHVTNPHPEQYNSTEKSESNGNSTNTFTTAMENPHRSGPKDDVDEFDKLLDDPEISYMQLKIRGCTSPFPSEMATAPEYHRHNENASSKYFAPADFKMHGMSDNDDYYRRFSLRRSFKGKNHFFTESRRHSKKDHDCKDHSNLKFSTRNTNSVSDSLRRHGTIDYHNSQVKANFNSVDRQFDEFERKYAGDVEHVREWLCHRTNPSNERSFSMRSLSKYHLNEERNVERDHCRERACHHCLKTSSRAKSGCHDASYQACCNQETSAFDVSDSISELSLPCYFVDLFASENSRKKSHHCVKSPTHSHSNEHRSSREYYHSHEKKSKERNHSRLRDHTHISPTEKSSAHDATHCGHHHSTSHYCSFNSVSETSFPSCVDQRAFKAFLRQNHHRETSTRCRNCKQFNKKSNRTLKGTGELFFNFEYS